MGPAPATALLFAAIGALYFVAGKLGLSFATVHSSASAVWPPTGIALGVFLVLGRRAWPAIFVGAFLVNITTAGSVLTSLGIAAGNTLEGVAGAWLVERFAGGRACFERARDVFKFAGLAAVAATTISATVGVTSLSLAGYARWEDFHAIWLTWWLGDATGALIVTPLLVLWHARPRLDIAREQRGEAIVVLLVVIGVAAACFVAPVLRDYPVTFLCLAPLAWIALRFGPREVATAIALLTTIAVVSTELGLGPFAMASRNESLLLLQAFMGMAAITLLPMAALVGEHRLAVAQAEEATRAREVFLAMLSHELRNPLQAITNALHLLSRPGLTEEQVARALGSARRQGDHLTRLLNDLLDVARAATGKISLDPRPVRLDEVARRSVESIKGSARAESRTLTVDAQPALVRADAERLQQIVDNLLTNAVKFTPAHGTIRVSVREEGTHAVLSVQDDGVGISGALLPKVFDLFTQGERRLDRREGGLGIGLTMVRTLAQLQGGSVQARSAGEGKGSEFVVRLPLERGPGDTGTPPDSLADAAGPATRLRVLVVEDNEDARESLCAVLAADGHEVHAAAQGEQGIDVARSVRPEVVFVDIGLPGLDGYEVARRLRAMQGALGVKWRLIALTGYGQQDDIRRGEEAGFDAHLVKPVVHAALQAAMRAGEAAPSTRT
jgi:signal transduction histidine kinase/ActR/RegA family two-component response regulator